MTLPRGIIVNQTDARRRGGLRAPLEVGVCRWRGVDDWLSVLVKMSLSIADDEAKIVEPHPISRAATDDYPTDFVMHKPRCDLMVVGHAHAKDAVDRIAISIALGGLTRRLNAIAREPALSIPLTSDHLRDEQGVATHLYPRLITREGDDAGYESFDHGMAQCSPITARLDYLQSGATLDITGLSPRGETRSIALPKIAPRAWFERHSELVPLELRCDTVFFDTDFERLDLVWRAVIPPQKRRVQRLVASLESMAEPNRDLDSIGRELPRGSVCWATEEVDTEAHDEELEMSTYEVLEHAAEPEMSLEAYAGFSARVAEQDRPREEILEELELDERSWGIEERAWVEKMGREAEAGDGTLAAEFAAFFLVAQDKLKKPHEPKPMETYVSVKAELERANKPKDVLEKRELCFGEWMRLERHWADEAAKDPKVMEELNALLTAARKDVRA